MIVLFLTFFISSAQAALERQVFLMGTMLEIQASDERVFDWVVDEVKRVERRISTWIPDSELSKLNQARVGQSVRVSDLLFRDLVSVIGPKARWHEGFSPFLGPLVEVWGLRGPGRTPRFTELSLARERSVPAAFEVVSESLIRKNREGAMFEEGGFGKGLALDRALERVSANGFQGALTLNFGGQILRRGPESKVVSVAHPVNRDEVLFEFSMPDGSVSTSGNGERGGRARHLLDPRSGRPARWKGSVTAFASTGLEAEVLSKLFVLGPDEGLRWANANGKAALWVIPDGRGGYQGLPSCHFFKDLRSVSSRSKIVRTCKG